MKKIQMRRLVGFFFAFSAIGFASFAQPSLNELQQAERQVVLLQNNPSVIPLQNLETLNIAVVSVGAPVQNEFTAMLRNYTIVRTGALTSTNADSLKTAFDGCNTLIVAVFKEQLTDAERQWLSASQQKSTILVCAFGNPAAWIKQVPKSNALVVAPSDNAASRSVAAQVLFGGIKAHGKLAASLDGFKKGFGLTTPDPIRFKYTLPEEAGVDGAKLNTKIDSLVKDAIAQQTFPGCVVLVAKEGKVIFNKAYGYHTYLKAEGTNYKNDPLNRKTDRYDLFDLASVTKVTAGCPSWLKLVDEGKVNLEEKFSTYFPLLKGTNKENITVKELLCHVGGLQPYAPFYKKVLNADGSFKSAYVHTEKSEEFPIRISPTLFARKDIGQLVYDSIAKSPLIVSDKKHNYVYSCWPFVMTPPVVEAIEHQPIEEFLQATYYRPLGASEMMYNPWRVVPLSRIMPTETDNFFRQTQLLGYVHDEASGLMGGHSCNAGLFANANDLAKLYQLYLQKGTYGGKRYFSDKTFDLFNSRPFEGVDRGICFDKPDLKDGKIVPSSYCSAKVSPESFGHTGYTGTMVWVDPKYNLVYIFLSNRVYPTRNNDKIVTTKIRAKVQTAIYEAIIAP
jgi:CubicO group peptidase (beta-lactamase class C family)